MTQLALDLRARETMIERVAISALRRGQQHGERTISAHGFQAWLADWSTLERAGWDVAVVVDRDQTHAVGLACREVTP